MQCVATTWELEIAVYYKWSNHVAVVQLSNLGTSRNTSQIATASINAQPPEHVLFCARSLLPRITRPAVRRAAKRCIATGTRRNWTSFRMPISLPVLDGRLRRPHACVRPVSYTDKWQSQPRSIDSVIQWTAWFVHCRVQLKAIAIFWQISGVAIESVELQFRGRANSEFFFEFSLFHASRDEPRVLTQNYFWRLSWPPVCIYSVIKINKKREN